MLITLKKIITTKLVKKLIAACFEVKPIAKDNAIRPLAKRKVEKYEIKKENGEIGARRIKVNGGISVKMEIKNQA